MLDATRNLYKPPAFTSEITPEFLYEKRTLGWDENIHSTALK